MTFGTSYRYYIHDSAVRIRDSKRRPIIDPHLNDTTLPMTTVAHDTVLALGYNVTTFQRPSLISLRASLQHKRMKRHTMCNGMQQATDIEMTLARHKKLQ
jgi:hypothetical protein